LSATQDLEQVIDMQLTLDSFKKASKRYASAGSLTLQQAQEGMATFFGFPNFHAAQTALRTPAEANASQSPSAPAFWDGLSQSHFFVLIDLLKRPIKGDGASWLQKAYDLMDGVLGSVAAEKSSIDARSLSTWMTLQAIEERYVAYREEHDGQPSTAWNIRHRAFGRYLELGLPAYDVDLLLGKKEQALHKKRQDLIAIEQHGYRMAHILPLLDRLEMIENAGGTKKIALTMIDGTGEKMVLTADESLYSLVDKLVTSRRYPTDAERLAFDMSAPLARTFYAPPTERG
jgi:hypothetical protein